MISTLASSLPLEASEFRLAARASRMNPSAIREILKLAELPGVLSLAGGLPSAETFPVEAVREATLRVLRDAPHAALQYAPSEGYTPLREWVAGYLSELGQTVTPAQVLITNGSQQGLDLVGKVLVDRGTRVAVESPTYLGALQAFAPYEPEFAALHSDDDGPLPASLVASGARLAYLLPNFQNPTGRCFTAARRAALVEAAREAGVAIVEDNPYGELWLDVPPPAPMAVQWPQGTVTLGSFSKVLAPGLRLGYVVAPAGLMPKLLQAKQAADLHTSGFSQRVVHAVLTGEGATGRRFLDHHLSLVRQRYRAQRDAMALALVRHLPSGFQWQTPGGGMFFWLTAPEGIDTAAMLRGAVARGVAYVPGSAFFADGAVCKLAEGKRASVDPCRTLRLSFATLTPLQIDDAVQRLACALSLPEPPGL